MRRRRFLSVAGGVLGSVWAGCSRRAGRMPPGTVRVAVAPFLTMSSFYLARELGFFSSYGLDLEVRELPVTMQRIPLLAGGEIDVAFSTLSPAFINAVARGASVKIVAGREIASVDCGDIGALYANRKAFSDGLTNLALLRGKRISIVRKAGIGEFWLEAILDSAGLRSDEVQIVELGKAEGMAALLGGAIDGRLFLDFEKDPAALSPEVVRVIGLAKVIPNFQVSHVVFGGRLLNADVSVGARFLAAYLRGAQEFLRGRTPRFMEEYARANGLDPKRTREACRNTFTPDGSIDFRSLQKFIDWAVRKGYCPQPLDAAQLVDSRFLEAARRIEPRR
jgi:NitT/TauT family transport system substrate-binding protein